MASEDKGKYEKTIWVDGVTPLNAINLNKIEEGVERAINTGNTGNTGSKLYCHYITFKRTNGTIFTTSLYTQDNLPYKSEDDMVNTIAKRLGASIYDIYLPMNSPIFEIASDGVNYKMRTNAMLSAIEIHKNGEIVIVRLIGLTGAELTSISSGELNFQDTTYEI